MTQNALTTIFLRLKNKADPVECRGQTEAFWQQNTTVGVTSAAAELVQDGVKNNTRGQCQRTRDHRVRCLTNAVLSCEAIKEQRTMCI